MSLADLTKYFPEGTIVVVTRTLGDRERMTFAVCAVCGSAVRNFHRQRHADWHETLVTKEVRTA